MNGHLDAAIVLLDAKANCHIQNDFGETALDLARSNHHTVIAELLNTAAKENPEDGGGGSNGVHGGGGGVKAHSNPLIEGSKPSKEEAVAQIHEMRDEMDGLRAGMAGLQDELVDLSQKHQAEMKAMMELLVKAIQNVQKNEHEEMLASIRREVEEEEFGPGGVPQFATDPVTGEQYELAEWAKDEPTEGA